MFSTFVLQHLSPQDFCVKYCNSRHGWLHFMFGRYLSVKVSGSRHKKPRLSPGEIFYVVLLAVAEIENVGVKVRNAAWDFKP